MIAADWKGVANVAAMFSALVVLGGLALFFPIHMKIRSEVNRKINTALADHYRGSQVRIITKDKGPLHSVCLSLGVRTRDEGRETKRFAMVQGDMDGGVWSFGREYGSMSQCQKDYLIGG